MHEKVVGSGNKLPGSEFSNLLSEVLAIPAIKVRLFIGSICLNRNYQPSE
jgi:hypothetical protein